MSQSRHRHPSTRRASYTHNARRRTNNGRWRVIVCLLIIAVIGYIVVDYIRSRGHGHDNIATDDTTALMWVDVPDDMPSQTITRRAITMSFNKKTHNANWVAWTLTGERARGNVSRSDNFVADPDLKGSSRPEDYRHSGYDRGHLAPAGDMKWDRQAMDESFYMTNITPQTHALNTGVWKSIEEKCRQRTSVDSLMVIIAGPVPGDKVTTRLGETGVVVPERFFKVILSLGGDRPYAIGFVVPNHNPSGGMQQYAMSVDEVEAITGYDFFAALDDAIEERLESDYNFTRWSRLK